MEHITGWRRSQSRPATKTGWMTRGSSAAQIDPQSFLTIQVDAKFMLEFSIFSFEGQVRQIVVDDIPYTIMPVTLTCAPNLVEHQLLWQQTITPLKLLLNSNVGPVRSARPNLKRTGPIRCNSIKNWLSSALGMPDGGQKHRRQRNVIVVKPLTFGLVGLCLYLAQPAPAALHPRRPPDARQRHDYPTAGPARSRDQHPR